jgi:hypothetical protein
LWKNDLIWNNSMMIGTTNGTDRVEGFAVIQGLDFVIAEAKKPGVYLILRLVNSWDGCSLRGIRGITWAPTTISSPAA